MVAARTHLATYADLEALGEEGRAEVISGVVVYKAMPSFEHSDAQSAIAGRFKAPYQGGRGGPGGWWLGTEVTIELGPHDVFVPDVAGWRKDRVPERPSGMPVKVRPDWVCEVLSPSNSRNDLGVKLVAYFRCEIQHYWIIDPMAETLTVFRRGNTDYETVLTATKKDVVRAEPFDAIELRVTELFGD